MLDLRPEIRSLDARPSEQHRSHVRRNLVDLAFRPGWLRDVA